MSSRTLAKAEILEFKTWGEVLSAQLLLSPLEIKRVLSEHLGEAAETVHCLHIFAGKNMNHDPLRTRSILDHFAVH